MPEHQPTFAELADWIDGRLDPAAAERVAQAVDRGTEETVRTAQWIARFRLLARELPHEQVPPIVGQNLHHRFERRAHDGRVGSVADAVPAQLVFDSRRDVGLVGVRAGEDTDQTVQLAFAAPGADMVLDIRRGPKCRLLELDGQIFVDGAAVISAFTARASGHGWVVHSVDGDLLGRFRLRGVSPGEIHLRVSNAEIVLTAQLDLREGRGV